MKRILSCLVMLSLTITMIGCSSKSNEEIESLKREIDGLKSANEKLMNQTKRVDLKLSGDFSVTVQKLIVEDPTTNVKNLALVSFFQASVFLLPVGEETSMKLKEGKAYTFKLLDSTIKDYLYDDFKKGQYSVELFLSEGMVKFELVGEAKEDELGMNSYRIKVEEVSK
ncbi:MAG: hypothetical protein RR630_02500 [Coprobacillus sp.]